MSLKKFAKAELCVGGLLLFCALLFYYFAVLRIDYGKTTLLDLGPHPDATEYFAQAKALLRDGWPSIQIAAEKLPSRYPVGYSVLMLPWLKILSAPHAVLAPFRTNQAIGLVLLLSVFGFYFYLEQPVAGGLAVLLIATLPGFFTFCRSSMSELSGSALIILAFMFAYLGLKEERRWKIYLAAVFLGLSINIRIQALFLAPLLLVIALFPARGTQLRWLVHCALIPVVFVLAASPVLVLNTVQFHSPFKTGYEFWADQTWNSLMFSPRYVPINAAALWREFTVGQLGYHTANIFGTGTSFVPSFILLACAGCFFIRFDRFVICAVPACLTFLVVILSHHFQLVDARYYLPLLMLLVAVAVLPVNWAAKNLFPIKGHSVAALGILILFAGACLGYPSRSGYNTPSARRCQSWDALHFADPQYRSTAFIAQKHFAKLLRKRPGIVLSDIDPVYLNALLPDSFVAAPIDGKHHYKWSKEWRFDRPQALALVERGLHQSFPVYALFVSRDEMIANESRLPSVFGYKWRVLDNSIDKAAILKLAPLKLKQTTPSPG